MDSALAVGLRWETAVFQQPVDPLAPRLTLQVLKPRLAEVQFALDGSRSSSLILSSLRKLTAVERSSARSSWARFRS